MRRTLPSIVMVVVALIVIGRSAPVHSDPPAVVAEEDHSATAPATTPPNTVAEARARARILHETIHGALQVMHRDYFDEENAFAIPSASLEDVFHELQRSHGVRVRWLIVETDVVNIDHKPQDAFERDAVEALAAGKESFEAVEEDAFRFAGAVRLASQCLKCHVKTRTTTEDRTAGLTISMPLAEKSK